MFPFNRIFLWVIATLSATLILISIPFSMWEVAAKRLEPEVSRSIEIQKTIASQCRELLANQNTPLERWFIEKIQPSSLNNTNPSCVVRVQSSHLSRFALFSQWTFGLEIFTDNSIEPIIRRNFSTSFPLPLCFLPLLLFIFLLPYSISATTSLVLLLAYMLFLNGLNLIPLIQQLPKLIVHIATTERLFPGLFILTFWFSLKPLNERRKARTPISVLENLVNSCVTHFVGIWNPILYTLFSPIFFHTDRDSHKIKSFLSLQLLIFTLSLYIYGLELSNVYSVVHTLWTPRYLSFAIVFSFLPLLVPKLPASTPILWELPNFGKYLALIGIVELAGALIPEVRAVPTLTRISLCLLIVDLAQFKTINWGRIFSRWKKPLLALTISYLIAAEISEFGAIDLILSICDPKKHPTAILPFTLLCGFLLGFLTGGLSFPFFTLVSSMIQSFPSPIIRAALFDGVLAGLMLSPFSLFNLFPAFQHNIYLQEVIKIRAKQLLVPLIMGVSIYFVGTVTNLSILPPVSFVFGCLIIITFRLRKSRWKIGRFDVIARNDQHSS